MKGLRMPLRRPHPSALALALAAFVALSCSDATAPDGVNERASTDLRLLAAPYGTPQLVTTWTSFYAVKGKVSGADIWYRPRAGRTDSTKFLEFRLGTASELPMIPSYGGCRSWVELANDLETIETQPVLDDRQFRSKLKSFRAALEVTPR